MALLLAGCSSVAPVPVPPPQTGVDQINGVLGMFLIVDGPRVVAR